MVIRDADGVIVKQYGEYIGEKTNNEAEYRAVISALTKLKQIIGATRAGDATVRICADSELLVKQMNGEYKISHPNIQKFFMEIWNLKLDFGTVTFEHVYREENKDADRMVNEALDKQLKTPLDF